MGPSWRWSLSSWDGPRYRLTGNHSEKKAAENILRAGSGSWTIRFSVAKIMFGQRAGMLTRD